MNAAPSLSEHTALTGAQLRALDILAAGKRLLRRTGGWGWPPHRVSLDVADSLIAGGLVRKHYSRGDAELALTYSGKALHAVSQATRGRRARP